MSQEDYMTERYRWAHFWESSETKSNLIRGVKNRYGYSTAMIKWVSDNHHRFPWVAEVKVGDIPKEVRGENLYKISVGATKKSWEMAKKEFELAETKENHE
jgi:hypothetical protein